MDLDSGNDMEQEFIDELNLVVTLLKEKNGWEKFVISLDGSPLIRELIADDYDLSSEQIAAFVFWRMLSVWIEDDGEVRSELVDAMPDDEDELGVFMVSSLRTWRENELSELLQSDEFIGFAYLSEMFNDYAPRSRDEMEAIMAEFKEQLSEGAGSSQIRPLSESEVPPILRSNPE